MFTMDSGGDLISFDITVVNPCWDTVFDAIAFADNPVTVVDGEIATTTWTQPATQVDTDTNIAKICGSMTFDVFLDNDETDTVPTEPWAVVSSADGTWTLTIDTTADLSLIANEPTVDMLICPELPSSCLMYSLRPDHVYATV